jgi:hypothetical protein
LLIVWGNLLKNNKADKGKMINAYNIIKGIREKNISGCIFHKK